MYFWGQVLASEQNLCSRHLKNIWSLFFISNSHNTSPFIPCWDTYAQLSNPMNEDGRLKWWEISIFLFNTLSQRTLKLIEIIWKRKRDSQRGGDSLYRVYSDLGFVQVGRKLNVPTHLFTFRTTGTITDMLLPSNAKEIRKGRTSCQNNSLKKDSNKVL